MNREFLFKQDLFQRAINLLSSSEINTDDYLKVMNDLLLRFRHGNTTQERKELLSYLLNRWMSELVCNYKIDYCYSHILNLKRGNLSIYQRLNSIAAFDTISKEDYHVQELISIANDMMAIVKERKWDVQSQSM